MIADVRNNVASGNFDVNLVKILSMRVAELLLTRVGLSLVGISRESKKS